MRMSTREDIGLVYGQFHAAKAQLDVKLLRLNKAKGWLVATAITCRLSRKVKNDLSD